MGDLIREAFRRLAMSSAFVLPVHRHAMVAAGVEVVLPVIEKVWGGLCFERSMEAGVVRVVS